MPKVIERKPYFNRLPHFDFYIQDFLPSDFAIVYTLYHSSKDALHEQYPDFNEDRFRNVHCKGAIYSAMSLIFNTNLGDCRVPFYFYLEKHIYDIAMEVFEKYSVDDSLIRTYTVDCDISEDIPNAHLGKKYGWLNDNDLKQYKNVVFFDNDVLAVGKRKMDLFNLFNSTTLKELPAVHSSYLIYRDYRDWVRRISESCGILPTGETLEEAELHAINKLGLDYTCLNDIGDYRIRHYSYTPVISIPMQHEIVDYIKTNMGTCYEDEAMFSAYAMCKTPLHQIVNLMPNWFDLESQFLHNYNPLNGCMAHLHTDDLQNDTRLEEYYDVLYEGLMYQTPYYKTKEMYSNE